MKYNRRLSLLFVGIVLYACSPTTGTQQDNTTTADMNSELAQSLLGEWRNSSLKITLNTAYGQEESQVIEYDESNWEQGFGMKPARTFFQESGTYYTEYRDLKDSVFQIADGTWQVMGDSLIMIEPDFTYRYAVIVNGDLAQFTAAIDGDEDGQWDDSYVETQRRHP